MNEKNKSILIWGGLILLFVVLISEVGKFGSPSQSRTVAYSQFLDRVYNGEIRSADINMQTMVIEFVDNSGNRYFTNNPEINTSALVGDLRANNVMISSEPIKQESLLSRILINLLPLVLFIGLFIFISRQMQGGGKGGAFSFGKSRAKLIPEDKIKVTFADVAGADEAKQDTYEMVEFLRDPSKFSKLGGKIPRGVLMVGPPGTGKTLLARAIAGEAKVPFFTISGSDFVEMFVGVGASRVRDMFEEAKKHAPCIIFIDEIDAVGRQRGAGLGGGHDEREQTLNQLLVEMDGFEGNEGVIVIAATNRPDVLDPALLRPGRFDRQVTVGLPDLKGREQILKVHMRKKPIDDNVIAKDIARGTPGFSGADLANLVNEAALFAARRDRSTITMQDLEDAKDKIMMGAERRSMVMSDKEKEMTAYHEAGHCIIGRIVPSHDPVYKVTIIPRGRALGVTMFLPEADRYSYSKERLESQISTLYGGRLAEELIYGAEQVSTGASNDIERATAIARNMVTQWGLSEKLGPLLYAEEEGEVFLGRSVTRHKNVSDDTAKLIDEEIRLIVDRNYERARQILEDNMDILHEMAKALVKYETIDEGQIDDLMARKPVRAPSDWDESGRHKIVAEENIQAPEINKPLMDGQDKPADNMGNS
ncbi:ATP-dependent zinc metalloprotease FtsH [Suttonella indologenes]|uniref:ATP-dependent zinc metalloprotease FtsH n=1 Tax=Suttonella indologenes TaxID=13276 RepID=A0A380MUM4_9GAMM|nr:ATP-dependent zinc metalloprotease FtsH [Suttonella indologenes]SUO96285.1 ATP-dependent zinc metalloprotease FtsH [Suttonella indologenes]